MKPGPVEEREVEEFGELGSQAKLRHQTKNIEIDTHLSNTTSLDSTNDRAWDLEALASCWNFSGSRVDGSFHGPAFFNFQANPILLAKALHFSDLIVGEHTEEAFPHIV